MIDFETRFKNWVRWCRLKGFHRSQAGSAEGDYRSPQVFDPPGPRPLPVNLPDAELFNRAYVSLAPYYRVVIKVLYFNEHWRPQYQAQRLKCHWNDLPTIGHTAKQYLQVRVEFLERELHNSRAVTTVRALRGAAFA